MDMSCDTCGYLFGYPPGTPAGIQPVPVKKTRGYPRINSCHALARIGHQLGSPTIDGEDLKVVEVLLKRIKGVNIKAKEIRSTMQPTQSPDLTKFTTTTPRSLIIVLSVIVGLTILTFLASSIFLQRWRRTSDRELVQEIPIEAIRFTNQRDIDSREGASVTTRSRKVVAKQQITTVPQLVTVLTTQPRLCPSLSPSQRRSHDCAPVASL
ncbi:hypothetical protein OF83DRAFT_1089066 [Amylostereum chailletii]|nr:hypothetical protein OF83DRAFT_1089066 [Amylostereum chailletii]